jgi:predicted secreted hydrolase
MSNDGINQNYLKVRPKDLFPIRGGNMLFLTKMVLVAVLLSGLISMSSYSSIANATTNNVITGDTQEYRIFEGQKPTMQPSDIGMATNPMPGVFEWWYFQGLVTGNSTFQITLLTKPWVDNNGPLQPYATIAVTTPNGTHLFGETKVDISQFKAARNTMNVTMGNTWARGDLNTVNLHFAPTENGVGADLVFESAAPPTRFGGSGMWYFDPSLTRFSATNDPMPFAKVNGNLTYEGQSHTVNGTGYIDKQWGTVNWNQDYDGWYWSTGHYGNYTVDMFVLTASAAYNNQQTVDTYLAKGNGPSEVLVETMQGVTAHTSGENITAPGGVHTYPEILTLQWKNGSNSATLTLTNPSIIAAESPVINTNATIYGYPQYMRLEGTGTLNVQWGGSNETASAPAIWEVSYTH